MTNPFNARATLDLPEGRLGYFRVAALEEAGIVELARLPFSIRILLENGLRHAGDGMRSGSHWRPGPTNRRGDHATSFPLGPVARSSI